MKLSQTRDCAYSEAECVSATWVAVNWEWEVFNASVLLHAAQKWRAFNIINLFQAAFPILLNMTIHSEYRDYQVQQWMFTKEEQRGTQELQIFFFFFAVIMFFSDRKVVFFFLISILKHHLLEIQSTDKFSVSEFRLDHFTSECFLKIHDFFFSRSSDFIFFFLYINMKIVQTLTIT